MKSSARNLFAAALIVTSTVSLTLPVTAQQRRSPFDVPRVSLASLPEVQAELKFTDEQKTLANSLQEQLVEDRRKVFQNGSGDWDAMRIEIEKLSNEASAKVLDKLDDGQKKRLTEIYVQANGPNALADKEVMEQLEISDEQVEALETAREDNRYAFFDAWQDFQGMSEEERREAMAELQEEADARLLEALNDQQREEFSKLGGEELEYDLTPLMPRRGG